MWVNTAERCLRIRSVDVFGRQHRRAGLLFIHLKYWQLLVCQVAVLVAGGSLQ